MSDLASRVTGAPAATENTGSVSEAQVDGNVPDLGGSGLVDSNYDVEVKLGDLQQNPDSILYSAKSFADMNLYVVSAILTIRVLDSFSLFSFLDLFSSPLLLSLIRRLG